jgi:hypothetical protein
MSRSGWKVIRMGWTVKRRKRLFSELGMLYSEQERLDS